MSSHFCGEIEHSIDAKGRLFIPAKFREQLGNRIVVSNGVDKCLYVYTMERWDEIVESNRRIPMTDSKLRSMARTFMSSAEELNVDSQGRVILTEKLLKHAGISKDIVTVGFGDKLEIWSKEIYYGTEGVLLESLSDVVEEMGKLGYDFQF